MTRPLWVEIAGYVASFLVFSAFYMKTMIPLRSVAIASNVAFLTYGLAGRLYPIAALHAILLPLNVLRLRQMRSLIRRVKDASTGSISGEWLIPLMTHHRYPAGHVLFRRGDEASRMYMVLEGTVRLEELGVAVPRGQLLGEIGLFAPENARMATAVCETEVEVGEIPDEKVLQLYYQNPEFGFSLVRLVIGRLLENQRLPGAPSPTPRPRVTG
ncbi:MAG TPA: cyclic nucleotide-binding domain-containing protein [Thermoanaerobaculia bacterium]|nr:cyclic nucleotide-binding domain-containing protein [Thermoanaerobaculia bacterium]